MAFQKLLAFTKDVSDLSDDPSLSPAELKAQFDAAPDEVRVYYNKLIDALVKTTAGDSGAKNIGATTITGLAGSDIQTVLESLNTEKVSYDDNFAGLYNVVAMPNLAAGVEATILYSGGEFVNGVFTVPKTGRYSFNSSFYLNVTNGNVLMWIYVNGIAKYVLDKYSNLSTTTVDYVLHGNVLFALNAGDQVKYTAISSSGSTVNGVHCHCNIVKVV